jgi:O-antigen/teichoic acid export membrane protein
VAYWYWHAGNAPLAEILALTAICVPVLGNPTALACAFWRGRKRFDKEAQYAVLQQAMFCALIVPVLLFRRNEVFVVCSFFVASCLSGLTIFALTWRHARPGAPDSESEHFGKHLTAMQVLSVVAGEMDKIAIWHVLGPIAVATYVIASRPVAKINRIIPFNFLILPIVSEREFTRPLRRKILFLALLVLAALLPLAAAFYLAAPFLFHLLFPGYAASVPYFRALLPVTVMGPVNAFIRTALTGAKKTGLLYATSIATPLVKIAVLLALVPPFGIWGALAATISGVAVALGMNFHFLLRAQPETSA